MALEREDIERLSEVFVTRKECTGMTEEFQRALANDSMRLAVIEQRLHVTNWLLTAIGGGVIAVLIKIFVGG